MDGMDEEGQKGKVAWCCDRHIKHRQALSYWILALTGSQWSVLSSDIALTCLGLRRTIRGSVVLYVLKFIQFVVRETSKWRIAVI